MAFALGGLIAGSMIFSAATAQPPATVQSPAAAQSPTAVQSPASAQSPATTQSPATVQSPAKSQLPATTQSSAKPQPAATTQSSQSKTKSASTGKPAPTGKPATGAPTRYLPNRFAGRAGLYYKAVWGIDSLSVKTVESGEIIRFAWRVLDSAKAGVLNDKKAVPSLIDPKAGVQLVVPTMEQIGQLRQTAPPETGKSYWMAFSNKGRIVKRGDRVNVVIGQFSAVGLMVD
jgi:hypothetical protein